MTIDLVNTYTTSLCVLKNGNIVGGLADSSIKIWSNGRLISNIEAAHSGSITALAVLENGYLVSGATDNNIKIWNTNFEKLVKALNGHTAYVNSLAVLKNGFLVSGSEDKSIKIWS